MKQHCVFIGMALLLFCALCGCDSKHTPPVSKLIPTTPATIQDLDVLISSRGSAVFRGRDRRMSDSDIDLIFLPQGELFLASLGLGVNDSLGMYDITSEGIITIHLPMDQTWHLGRLSLRKTDDTYLIFIRGGEKDYGKTPVGVATWPLRLISVEDGKDVLNRLKRIQDIEKQRAKDAVQNP